MVVRISAILGRNPRFQSVRESLMRFVSGNRSYTAFRPRFQAFRRTPCERPSDALPSFVYRLPSQISGLSSHSL